MGLGAVLGLIVSARSDRAPRKSRPLVRGAGQAGRGEHRTISHEIDLIEIRVIRSLPGGTIEVVLADVKQFRAANQDRRSMPP